MSGRISEAETAKRKRLRAEIRAELRKPITHDDARARPVSQVRVDQALDDRPAAHSSATDPER